MVQGKGDDYFAFLRDDYPMNIVTVIALSLEVYI
jgi:hypothetical protein